MPALRPGGLTDIGLRVWIGSASCPSGAGVPTETAHVGHPAGGGSGVKGTVPGGCSAGTLG